MWSILLCVFLRCMALTHNCDPGKDCVVNCNGDFACDVDTINCPAGYSCEISCSGEQGCWGVLVSATTSTELTLIGCSGTYTCEDMDIYCPPNVNKVKKCHIPGTNTGLRQCPGCSGDPGLGGLNFYAINGWLDIDFSGYTGTIYGSTGGILHCLNDFSVSCGISSVSWSCANSQSACQTITMSPTADPTIIPSFYPTIVPSFYPSTIPTLIPSFYPIATTNPTIIPTESPTAIPTLYPTEFPTSDHDGSVGNQKTTNDQREEANDKHNEKQSFLWIIFIMIGVVAILVILFIIYFFCSRHKGKTNHTTNTMNIHPTNELQKIQSVSVVDNAQFKVDEGTLKQKNGDEDNGTDGSEQMYDTIPMETTKRDIDDYNGINDEEAEDMYQKTIESPKETKTANFNDDDHDEELYEKHQQETMTESTV